MKKTMKDYEDQADENEWNKRMKRQWIRYTKANEENQIEEKKRGILSILELLEEKNLLDYKLDIIIHEQEEFESIEKLEDIIVGRKKVVYRRTQAEWNREMDDALENGRLWSIIGLIKAGRNQAFIRKTGQKEEELYDRVRDSIRKIGDCNERNERE